MILPHVDVLLPVYRTIQTLPEAVDDLLLQEGVTLRILAIVDTDPDNQDDGTLAWLQERSDTEPRVVLLEGKGQGPGPALQVGLNAVKAPLVSHMEADDRCPPHRLSTLVRELKRDPSLQGVTSQVEQVGAATEGMSRYITWQNTLLTHEAMSAERFVEIPALHQTGLYHTASLQECGGYEPQGPWPLDIDFWYRWFAAGCRVGKVDQVLYSWRQHPGQSTRSDSLHHLDALRLCKIHYLEQCYGRTGSNPRPIHLISTGQTLEVWTQDLRRTEIDLIAADSWRPGEPPPALPQQNGPLLLAAYGRHSVRNQFRDALGNPSEPETLLFTA
ncbi:MAG: glycosyltransferase family 2 protein [Planctomycetota bacterium]|nr:glycosyltransferase family 2 protein [Planctomycetota bacterium]